MMNNSSPVLSVRDLNVIFPSRHGNFQAVKSLSFELYAGEILGIVGESGAGKSTVGNAIAALLTPPGYVSDGEIFFQNKDLRKINGNEMRCLRGKDIGFIFQDPMTSLNPLFRIEQQIVEPMLEHLNYSYARAKKRAISLLTEVGIDDAAKRIAQYPHQFSGGMRQRVVIAIALATQPKFIIADEPTTALDVSIQDQILQLIRRLCHENNVACMLVTHDMGVVSTITDRVMVMYRGEKVEEGETKQLLNNPQHDYSKSLIAAVPPSDRKLAWFPTVSYIEDATESKSIDLKTHWLGEQPPLPPQAANLETSTTAPLLQVTRVSLRFLNHDALLKRHRVYLQAVDDVSFAINGGETFGLVGESGSGKSTIARIISGLYTPDSGNITFANVPISTFSNEKQRRPWRRYMQMVFQNPYSSLNPRMRIRDIIAEPMRFYRLVSSPAQLEQIVNDLLEHVGLPRSAGIKFAHEFSGGQRQRISIARALATKPRLLICDEPTSALDVSVQAQILNLLKQLQQELQLTMLFISHDLPVIRQMCDRIGVMKHGKLLEVAATDELFEHPRDAYTKQLIQLMPKFECCGIKD